MTRNKSSCIILIFDARVSFWINSLPYCLSLIPTTLENLCSNLSIVNVHFNFTLATEKDLRFHIKANPSHRLNISRKFKSLKEAIVIGLTPSFATSFLSIIQDRVGY